MNNVIEIIEELSFQTDSRSNLREQLLKAFALFNSVSQQLTDSHLALENRVKRLQKQFSDAECRHVEEMQSRTDLEDQFDHLLQLLPVGVVILGHKGFVKQCNDMAIDLLGEPLEGERWVDIINRSFAPQADDGHEISLKDGRLVNVMTRSLKDGKGQMIIISDLTETRQLQSRIEKNRRVWELGKMSAALAHQIRTPLSSAMLYASQMKKYDMPLEQRDQLCDRVLKSLYHLESQIKDVLNFVKPSSDQWSPISIQQLWKNVENSLGALLLTSKSRFKVTFCGDSSVIHCHQEALQGALVNIVQNGIEACLSKKVDKDELKDEEERCVDQSPKILVECSLKGDKAIIKIMDNGGGIPERVKSRIFDPFFSTKQNGNGLGLAVVKQILDAHGVNFYIEDRVSSHQEGASVIGSVFVLEF